MTFQGQFYNILKKTHSYSLNVLAIPKVTAMVGVNENGRLESYCNQPGMGRIVKSNFPPLSYFSTDEVSLPLTAGEFAAIVVVPAARGSGWVWWEDKRR